MEEVFENNKIIVLVLLTALYFAFRLLADIFGNRGKFVLCMIIILSGLSEAIWGLLQLYGYLPSQHNLFKITGSFFNPGPYAGYLAVVFPLSLFYLISPFRLVPFAFFPWRKVQGTRLPAKGIACATCMTILLVLPAAMSRAAWLAAIAGGTVVIYKKYEKQLRIQQYYSKYKKRIWLIISLIFLISLISLTGLYYLKKDSADGRLLTWKISLHTIAKRPLGAGLGNFAGAYGEAQAEYFASGKASETEAHVAGSPEYGFNEYLQIPVESGIVAFLFFIFLVFLALCRLLQQDAGMAGALVALLVFAGFSYPFSLMPFLLVFVFLIGWNVNRAKLRKYHLLYLRSILIISVTAICLFKLYPVYEAKTTWDKNRVYYYSGMYNEVAQTYKPLYPFLSDRTEFLFEYGRSLSKIKQYEESNCILQKALQISCDPMLYNIMGQNYQAMRQYDRAEAAFVHSANLVPNRLYPWYLLCKLHTETGQREKAAEMAKIVLTKEPKVQSQAVREMRDEVRKLGIVN